MGQPTNASTSDSSLSAAQPTPTTTAPAAHPAHPSSSSSAPQPTPSSVDSLPPAALDLATKLFDFARAGAMPELSQYISAGIPPNMTNHAGDTLLMLAAYHGHAATVQMLLDKGADPNVVNDRGQSPIAGAVFKGYEDVVKVLYEGGANARGAQPSAVDCARMFKRDSMLRLFGEEV